jgi:hypothetical protein
MIAAALLAAGLLAPAGVTAGIQADPVCLPVTAQPGHSYPLTVYVQGSDPLTLAVAPAHGTLERTLHQVPSSWVHFSSNPASTGQVALTLAVPPDAGPGAYWSDIEAGTQGQAQPGAGAQAALGAAATTALVLTVGPSSTPPPPCDDLDLAQSTGKFPAWPTKAFKTNSWKQVFAPEERAERAAQHAPTASPTATTADSGAHAAPAAAYSPAANAPPAAQPPAGNLPKVSSDWPGWLFLIGLAAAAVAWRRKRSRS